MRHLFAAGCTVLACATISAAQDADTDDTHAVVVEVRSDVTPLSDGRAVPGALVTLAMPGRGPAESVADAVGTDGAGRALLDGVRGDVTLLVFGEGLAPVAQRVRASLLGGPVHTTVVVEEGLRKTLRVVDPRGEPIAGAAVVVNVLLDVAGSAPLWRHAYAVAATTDDDGRAAFADLPRAGAAAATARAKGWLTGPVVPFRFADTGEPTIVLRRGGRIAGRAREVPGGGPAAGVTLVLGDARAVTDAQGAFEFRGVGASGDHLVVEGDRYVLRDAPVFVAEEGEVRDDVLVTLTRAAELSGDVFGPGGESLDGAEIRVEWPPREDGRPDAVTQTADEAGSFLLRGLVPADGVRVEARFPGFVPAVRTGLSLVPGEDAGPIELVLEEGGRLTGRVVGAGARGIVGVEIAVRRQSDGPGVPPIATTRTDSTGAFRLFGVPRERVLVEAVPPAVENLRRTEFGPFVATSADPLSLGDLVLLAGYEVTVLLVDGPADTEINVLDSDGTERSLELGTDGAAYLAGFGPGPAVVTARDADGVAIATADIVLPTGWPVELVPVKSGAVTLQAVGPAAAAVTQLEILAEAVAERGRFTSGDERAESQSFSLSDPDGRFSFVLPRGRHRLAFRSGPLHGALDVAVGAFSVDLGVVRLARGETVRGEVMSSNGDRLEGARIVVEPANAADWPSRESAAGARGRFAVDGVPVGVARAVVTADGHAPYVSRPLAVRAGALVDLGVVTLSPGVLVRGTVTSAAGLPAAGVAVDLEHDAGFDFAAETDSLGRYELRGVPTGSGSLTVAELRIRIDIPALGRERVVDVDLFAGTQVIGRVLRGGAPQPFAELLAYGGDDARVQVATRADAAGAFTLPPLPAGPAEIEVLPLFGLPHIVNVELSGDPERFLEVELPAAGVRGAVRDAPTGAGVAGARVQIWELTGNGERTRDAGAVRSGVGGEFHVLGLLPGRYEVEAFATGRGVGLSRALEVRAGEPVAGVDVTLSAGAVLRVRLVDAQGRAVPGGWLSALPDDVVGPRFRMTADASIDGRVVLRDVPTGTQFVEAGAGGRGRVALGVFELYEGDDVDVGDVELPLAGSLRITAIYPGGFLPAAGVAIEIADLAGRDPRSDRGVAGTGDAPDPLRFTGQDGRVHLTELAPGRYRVRAFRQAGSGFENRPEDVLGAGTLVDVRSGETADITLWAPSR